MIPARLQSHKISFLVFFVIVFLLSSSVAIDAKYNVSCRSAILSNSTKVKRLYGKRVNERVLPASTTKVMTALLVMEKLDMDKMVTISQKATLPQPSKLHAKAGDKYKVRDLMYAILLGSSNDAAVALAEAVAGSHWKFVEMMNARAKQLGAKHTKFANAHGLPSKGKQYTTAYDMYLIFRQALKYPFFKEAIKIKHKTITSQAGRTHSLRSHNKMLFFDWKNKIYGKTGYTRAAQACFIGTTQKGNSTLIVGVFGCSRRWDDIKYMVSAYGGVAL